METAERTGRDARRVKPQGLGLAERQGAAPRRTGCRGWVMRGAGRRSRPRDAAQAV